MPVKKAFDNTSAQQQIRHIIKAIRAEEQILRQRFPILHYQNWLGLGILLCALAGMLSSAYLYYLQDQPFYLRQLVAGKALKVLREQGLRRNDLTTFFTANRRTAG